MSTTKVPLIKLNDCNDIPVLGLGTANTRDLKPGEYRRIFLDAIDVGYRHFDTAYIYGNHQEIAAGLKQAFSLGKVKRGDLYITTKIWNTFHKKESAINNCKTCLDELQLDYVDLLLMHFPMGWKEGGDPRPRDASGKFLYSNVDYLETWQGLEECYRKGWARSIGVSNFNKSQLERLLPKCRIKPVVNQIETHPYLSQQELVDFCQKNEVTVTAYSPLGAPYAPSGRYGSTSQPDEILIKNSQVSQIAWANGKTTAQILLRWAIQRGTVVIPKSINRARMTQNMDIFNFELNDNDMYTISKLERNWRALTFDAFTDHQYFPF